VLSKVIDRLHYPNLNYLAMIANIPTLTDSATSIFSVPDLAPTRQLKWALFISRMDWIDWIISLDESKISTNRRHINEIYSLALSIRNEGLLKTNAVLNNAASYYITRFIDLIRRN
jgi:hypothetical protein